MAAPKTNRLTKFEEGDSMYQRFGVPKSRAKYLVDQMNNCAASNTLDVIKHMNANVAMSESEWALIIYTIGFTDSNNVHAAAGLSREQQYDVKWDSSNKGVFMMKAYSRILEESTDLRSATLDADERIIEWSYTTCGAEENDFILNVKCYRWYVEVNEVVWVSNTDNSNTIVEGALYDMTINEVVESVRNFHFGEE